ncbi:tryptophan halogenase family protein [Parvularcula maris]|nr:tryptophan halogenase family protein [Parvularcula maris]
MEPVENVLIVGGGTAGWITAAAMAKLLPKQVQVTLVESDAIGTVGVGEATIPQIRRLNMLLGIDEMEFLRETKGTFKLGIEFNNWGRVGDSYIHTFGEVGMPLGALPFHHYWLRARQGGSNADLWRYSLHRQASDENRFGLLERVGNTKMEGLAFAFHFDAGLYAQYLRRYAEARGVKRIEGKVQDVSLHSENGRIETISLESSEELSADLFIDCSGFRGLLIGEALGVGYEDWSQWLPCDRAVAVPCERTEPLLPYTKATARDAGWQWRIPLQHRTGNGHVYCSKYLSDDEAVGTLLSNLDGQPTADPKPLRFTTGRRERFWHKNCVSIGLASGFLEPLESTSIHLIQSNVSRLLELFPNKSFDEATIGEYNRLVGIEYELIRDFLVLHYHQTEREDTEFWRYCRHMSVPETLREKMELFGEAGILYRNLDDLFREASWLQVMLGQGITPKRYHPMADRLSDDQLRDFLSQVERLVQHAVSGLPRHEEFIAQRCAAAA